MRIELTPAAKKGLVAVTEKFGLTQLAANSKIIQFVCEQDQDVQAAILNLMPTAIQFDTTSAILKRMSDD